MNSNRTPASQQLASAEERAFRRLKESKLFQTYQSAFKMATGVPVYLLPVDAEGRSETPDGNPFCRMINCGKGCSSCGDTHDGLAAKSFERASTTECFAGLKESMVPIRAGSRHIAYLKIGQVFEAAPEASEFAPVAKRLQREGFTETRIEQLQKAWLESEVVGPDRYVGCITLLNAFALQLSEELNRLLVAEENTDPPTVQRAKQYINANLEEKITLDAVAEHVHVSPFYFCKIFKQATGMTLTEYVNRRRIERAKRRLLDPHVRITEVAYDVGYQSLSQFNRSFLKYAGQSPTHYRERANTQRALEAA